MAPQSCKKRLPSIPIRKEKESFYSCGNIGEAGLFYPFLSYVLYFGSVMDIDNLDQI